MFDCSETFAIFAQKREIMELYDLYPSEFQNLLNQDYENDSYIGQGNPSSKILIIGKECAITKDDDFSYDLFRRNAKIWKEKSPENLVNWFEGCSKDCYHPRRPFFGQLLLKDNNSSKNPLPWEKLNKGTSVTWKAYQQFINLLLPEDLQVKPKQQLNFYDYCFLTELSSNCMKTSKKNYATEESIKQRLGSNGILNHPFFKKFPVVILSVYHYIDWYKDIHIIEQFDGGFLNYEYKGIIVSEDSFSLNPKGLQLYKVNKGFKKGEFINVHESTDGKHILLHTNHFVDNFHPRSEIYLKEIAELTARCLNKYR